MRDDTVWTLDAVQDHLTMAGKVIRARPGSGLPKEYGNAWPDTEPDPEEAYGYNETEVRITYSPRQEQEADEVLTQWLPLLPLKLRKVVGYRAIAGFSLRQIGGKMRISHEWARIQYRAGLMELTARLNRR
ncbi:MAG: DUF6362 family protein [Pseudomonadota bacterium]